MKDNEQEIFPIVDEQGRVVGKATRGECHSGSKLLHPVVHLHVFNEQGDVYLQKRPEWKDIQPGKWDTAVGGHIDYGETPKEALQREAREELGITEFTPEFVGKYVFESQRERELVYVHRTIYNGEIRPSKDELDGGRFWTMQEICEAMGQGVLTPNFESEFQRCFLKQFKEKYELPFPLISYLNTVNIERSKDGVEFHPLIPFLPENAKVLFLGSFPPQRKRWCMDFYYPNFINDHWRIEGQIFYGDKNHFVDLENKCFKTDEIVAFCHEKGLAFFDTSTAIRRLQDNASDKFLEVVEPTDIHALIQQLPHLRAIVTTGEKATETICAYFGIPEIPKVNTSVALPSESREGVVLYRLPSSSRAYPLSFDKKVEAYRRCFSKFLD